MALNITQDDYNILRQSYIKQYIKLDLLDFNMNVVDEMSGNLIGFSVAVDANADLRRSCECTLVVTDSSFEIKAGGKIFLDKYIRPWIGYLNIRTGNIQWYNQGIYLINAPSYQYDAATYTLSFSGLDLMSKLTGLRNGELPGVPTKIPIGSDVRGAIIAALELGGFNKYIVSECKNVDDTIQEVPYDIEIAQGGTVYDILKELCAILPQYQMYFDADGVFHYEPIPTGLNDPVLIDDDVWQNILISESVSTDFENVKNYIEVYGRSHDIDHFSDKTTVNGSTVTLHIPSLTPTETGGSPLQEWTEIGFVPPSDVMGDIQLTITAGASEAGPTTLGTYKLVDKAGAFITALTKDKYYVAQFQADGTFLDLGQDQAYGIAYDNNPNSPFYVGNPIGSSSVGIIRHVCYSGEYDNITSNDLAKQRADLELYWGCRLNDSISLATIPIPWLDVNIIMSHAMKLQGDQKKYMIQSYNAQYGDSNSMTISASSWYPYYLVDGTQEPVELEYIMSTGTQFISTGFIPNNNTRVEMVVAMLNNASGYLFGSLYTNEKAAQEDPDTYTYYSVAYNNGTFTMGYNQDNVKTITTGSTLNRMTVDMNKSQLTINGQSVQYDASEFKMKNNMALLTYTKDGFFQTPGLAAILYSCKIWDNGALIRDYIPYQNKNGDNGLWDKVNSVFYGNFGTGEFIAGPVVNNK